MEDQIADIFAYWLAVRVKYGKTAEALFTPDRKRTIRARLKNGYDVATLKRAIDGLFLSPLHLGENDRGTQYLDVTHALKNGKNVEQFCELSARDGSTGAPRDPSRRPALPLPPAAGPAPNLKLVPRGTNVR